MTTSGIDTSFLVAAEVAGHPGHDAAVDLLRRMLRAGAGVALAPQVLAEFVHVVSDPRRFERPLAAEAALQRAARWWNAAETRQVFPDGECVRLFLGWMAEHRLGRKRLLDTLLAATYVAAGIGAIVTFNPRDFEILDGIEVVVP